MRTYDHECIYLHGMYLQSQGGQRKRRDQDDRDGGEQDQKRARTHWQGAPAENPNFDEYYLAQGICPPEEWDEFLATLRKQLPITFRINASARFANDLRKKLEKDFISSFKSGPIQVDGEEVNPPHPLPWYPDSLAWQLDLSRTQLRKVDSLKDLHEFMKNESEIGSITRQEAVSMIPPLFLDVKPHHRVLDMCAAPGSKTFQILEALHAAGGVPTGVVVANDADSFRCSMLTHQSQRMGSPCLVVTNHEAQMLPLIPDTDPTSEDVKIMYDRILCDVPCSGDGTLRKQPDIWTKWSPASGNGLHNLQIRIALRGCELLKVGGRLVYSTCSFNPIEDEAVVAEILRKTKGAMRLVDVSKEMRGLRFQPGLTSWKVKDLNRWYDNWEDGKRGYKLEESMFPHADVKDMNIHLAMRFLPHHQNTGGFFVAVLEKMEDVGPLVFTSWHKKGRSTNESTALKVSMNVENIAGASKVVVSILPNNQGVQDVQIAPRRRKKGNTALPAWGIRGGGTRNRQEGKKNSRWRSLDPVVPFLTEEYLKEISKYYGLSEDCPIMHNLVSRSTDLKPKKLFYLSHGPKLLLQMDANEQIKVIATGLKMFDRQESKDQDVHCPYRIAQEGLPVLLPYITRQIYKPTRDEFVHLLKERILSLPEECRLHKTDKMEEGIEVEDKMEEGTEVEAKSEEQKPKKVKQQLLKDSVTLEEIKSLNLGCCVAVLRPEDLASIGLQESSSGGLLAEAPFAVPCWRGRGTMNVMVSKLDCSQMLERLEHHGSE